MPESRKLAWQCRRGNLELDLMLQHYLLHEFAPAGEADQKLFRKLLTLEDNQLFAILMGDTIAAEFPTSFIDKIRGIRHQRTAEF